MKTSQSKYSPYQAGTWAIPSVVVLFAALTPLLLNAAQTDAYLLDSNGNVVTSGNTGLCVRTNEWKPGLGIAPCDPPPKEKVAAPVVPAVPIVTQPVPAVVQAPVPKPVIVQVPPVQKISLSADVLFDFDKSELRPAGISKLKEVIQTLNGAASSSIMVLGHADRLGPSAYNRTLSQARANAVRSHLVSLGIPGDQVRAEGRGETQPQTQTNACNGLPRAKTITCLQPDRRVDLEVTAIKPAS